jgi:hypothetical protein
VLLLLLFRLLREYGIQAYYLPMVLDYTNEQPQVFGHWNENVPLRSSHENTNQVNKHKNYNHIKYNEKTNSNCLYIYIYKKKDISVLKMFVNC